MMKSNYWRCTRLLPHRRAAPLRVTAATYIAFDELPDENWAIAGKLLDEE